MYESRLPQPQEGGFRGLAASRAAREHKPVSSSAIRSHSQHDSMAKPVSTTRPLVLQEPSSGMRSASSAGYVTRTVSPSAYGGGEGDFLRTLRDGPAPTNPLRSISPRVASDRTGHTAYSQQTTPSSAPTGTKGVGRRDVGTGAVPLSIPRGVTSAHQIQQQNQQNETSNQKGHRPANATSREIAQADQSQGHRVYTVSNMPSAGSLFVAITKALVARGDWIQIEPLGLKEVKAGPMPGSPGSINPCCSKLRGVNLFMGEKTLAEKLMAEARIVALRGRRTSLSASTVSARQASGGGSCSHTRRATLPENMATGTGDNLVCYLEGSRCITMKSRMVKTLVAYYQRRPQLRLMRHLYEYLPVTFILTPLNPARRMTGAAYVDERDAMIDTMKTINDEDPSGNVSTWIAKCSNGCHGDGIKIVKATTGGLKELLSYIDGFKDGIPWVVCRYIDRPLLYQKRKFDLRVWVTVLEDGRIYMHKDLVMRLSSVPYNPALITTNTKEGLLANITNHCIQTTSETYGLDEAGNELWWDSLQRLLLETAPPNGQYSAPPTPPTSPSKTKGSSPARGDRNGRMRADDAALLQMQRIIVESFAATKESLAREKGLLTGSGDKHANGLGASAVSSAAVAASSAVGGTVVGGMPALPSGVIPYPTFIHGAASTTTCAQPANRNTIVASPSVPPPPMQGEGRETSSSLSQPTRSPPLAFKKLGCESFHIFGFDFLIDDRHQVWLLEINGSPGVAEHLLKRIVDDTIELVIDPRFPPLNTFSPSPSRVRNLSPQRIDPSARASPFMGRGGANPRERPNGYELIYGPGVNKAIEYYRLHGFSGKGYE